MLFLNGRRNVSKALEESVEEEQDEDKTDPKLGEKDQRSYETIQKTIKGLNNIVSFLFCLHMLIS